MGIYKFLASKFCEFLVNLLEIFVVITFSFLAGKLLGSFFPDQINTIFALIGFLFAAVLVFGISRIVLKYVPDLIIYHFFPVKPFLIIVAFITLIQWAISYWHEQGFDVAVPALLTDWKFILAFGVIIGIDILLCKLIEFGYRKLVSHYSQ